MEYQGLFIPCAQLIFAFIGQNRGVKFLISTHPTLSFLASFLVGKGNPLLHLSGNACPVGIAVTNPGVLVVGEDCFFFPSG